MKKIIFWNSVNITKLKHKNIKKNIIFIIFFFIFFVGIIIGAVSESKADDELLKKLDFVFLTNFNAKCSQNIFSIFISSFASVFIFLIVIFLLGLSVWGGIIVAIIPFFKGYGYGLSVGWLYYTHGFYGIIYNILIILPGAFICSAVIIAASQEAFKNSLKFMSYLLRSDSSAELHTYTNRFLASMLWCLALGAVSSLTDMFFSICFSWIFNF